SCVALIRGGYGDGVQLRATVRPGLEGVDGRRRARIARFDRVLETDERVVHERSCLRDTVEVEREAARKRVEREIYFLRIDIGLRTRLQPIGVGYPEGNAITRV